VTDAPALWTVYDIDDVFPRQVIIRNRGERLRQERQLDKNGNLLSELERAGSKDDGTVMDRPIHHDLTPILLSSSGSRDGYGGPGSQLFTTETEGRFYTAWPGPAAEGIPIRLRPPGSPFIYRGALLTGTLPLERSHEPTTRTRE